MTPSPRPLAALLAAAVLLSACATTRPAEAPRTAEVEVVNRTGVDLWISVRGQVEGTARAGRRLRVRYLTPGPAAVRAAATPSERDAKRSPDVELSFDGRLDLAAGQRAVWDLKRPGTTPPEPPPLADLRVVNRAPRDLEVRLDGSPLGTVMSGDARTFRDLISGTHALRAADRSLKTIVEATLEIRPDRANTWEIQVPGGKLTVINDTDEPVELQADDRPLGRLAPGERRAFEDLGVGVHEVSARSSITNHRYQKVVELRDGVPQVWGLASGSATLVLVNLTGEDLTAVPSGTLVPSSARTLEIPAGAKIRVENVFPGRIGLNAVSAKTGTLYKMEAELEAGQLYHWDITPARAGLRVVNATAEELTLYAGGARLGAVAPRGARVLPDLPREAFTLEAFDKRGERYQHEVPAEPRAAATWTVRARTGSVKLVNRRPEAMVVYVDAKRAGEVLARATLTLSSVAVGERLIEAVGRTTEQTLKRRVTVAEGALAEAELADPRGAVTIENRSGEPLVAQAQLGGQQRLLPDGARVHYHLPAGRQILSLLGQKTELAYRRQVHVVAEQTEVWVVVAPTGTLAVDNQLDEPIALSVDGAAYGTLAPGAFREIRGLQAGAHRLRAQGETSGRILTARRHVDPDGRTAWRLVAKPARLLVHNKGQEPIQVTIDERPYGVVPGESRKIFADLTLGERLVDVIGMRSRVPQQFRLTLEGERTDVLVVHPPQGTVVIDNQSGEDVIVRVDGRQAGRIAAGRPPTPVPVPAGLQVVQVERAQSNVASTYRLKIRPQRAVHIAVAGTRVRLAVANKTDQALTVLVDDREVGTVSGQESLVVEDLNPGSVRLRARNAKGEQTHAERRELTLGPMQTWILR